MNATEHDATNGPDALLVGYPRCATSYVASELNRTGLISLTEPKETHFLSFPGPEFKYGGPGDEAELARIDIRSQSDWYRVIASARARQPDAPVVEASAETAYLWSSIRERVAEFCPGTVKMVAIVRDPVERAVSAHTYLTNRGSETLSFEKALEAEPERIADHYQHLWHYAAESRYETTLPQLVDAVGDRLLLVDYADVSDRPAWAMTRILRHLGVDGVVEPNPERVNASGEPRSRAVQAAINWVRSNDLARTTAKVIVPHRVRESIRRANLRRSGPDDDLQYRRLFADTYDYLDTLRASGAFGEG